MPALNILVCLLLELLPSGFTRTPTVFHMSVSSISLIDRFSSVCHGNCQNVGNCPNLLSDGRKMFNSCFLTIDTFLEAIKGSRCLCLLNIDLC